MIKLATKWAREAEESGITGFNNSINDQLEGFDKAQTGVGLIMLSVPVEATQLGAKEEDDVVTQETELQSVGAMRIRGQWYIITDENLSDIFLGVIGMVQQNMEQA